MDPLPVPTAATEDERAICALQHGFEARLRASCYYLVEPTKSDGAFTVLLFRCCILF